MIKASSIALGAAALFVAAPALAATSPFDLRGPALRVSVTHTGVTLPIAEVPNLSTGDTISVSPDLPQGQGARYVLIAGFLRGATNPPPKKWFFRADTWEQKKQANSLTIRVPDGARQLVLFLMPKDHGDFDAVVSAVRKQPGTFVRASQELNQASLDRARLDTFLDDIHALESNHPERIAATSPVLTRSLSIKLKADCLDQPIETQAACLTQDRESLLLADSHSSELADTLAGAPTDLAFQISSTAKAGYGYYSPYIGMARDIARIFGAFQSTQLQYIPAITRDRDDRMRLLLNAAPSFGKPASVMVVAMPAIEPPESPALRRSDDTAGVCALDDPLVLPIEGAPLIYAARYAHDMVLRVPRAGGAALDLPVTADPERGGYVVAAPQLAAAAIDGTATAHLHGSWGFVPFDGPAFRIETPGAGRWTLADPASSVVVGRDNVVTLAGAAPSCVQAVTLEQPGASPVALKWQQAGEGRITATLPLAKADPGEMTLAIANRGANPPVRVAVKALSQAAQVNGLDIHDADDVATLTGTRLDTVASMAIGSAAFRPGKLTRAGDDDRLEMIPADAATSAALPVGTAEVATITLRDGRVLKQRTVIAPARAVPHVLQLHSGPVPGQTGLPITLTGDGAIAADAPLTFSFQIGNGAALTGTEKIEVATRDGRASAMLDPGTGYMLQNATVGIVSFTPATLLGAAAFGALRFRLVNGDHGSAWAPLPALVRLPGIAALVCPDKAGRCTLSGTHLFLVAAIATDASGAGRTAVPQGFAGNAIDVPRPQGGTVYLTLSDDPQATATVTVPPTR